MHLLDLRGTGKSYRAQLVASEKGINYIIDDGLLIKDNTVIAGMSAKKAPTKVETVRKALFTRPEEQNEVKKVLKKYKPESILVLGTSDDMVNKIIENLDLPDFTERIYITDVATDEEIRSGKENKAD